MRYRKVDTPEPESYVTLCPLKIRRGVVSRLQAQADSVGMSRSQLIRLVLTEASQQDVSPVIVNTASLLRSATGR